MTQMITQIAALWLVCKQRTMRLFLTHHGYPSHFQCSSHKATDPISIALSSTHYAKRLFVQSLRAPLFEYKDLFSLQKIWLWTVQSIIAYCRRRFTYARQRQERFTSPPSPAVAFLTCSTSYLAQVNTHVQPPMKSSTLSATFICAVTVLGLCRVQGETKMHCLLPTFSSPSCSDTEVVCLAASETILSSTMKLQQTWQSFYQLWFLFSDLWPSPLCVCVCGIQWLTLRHYFWSSEEVFADKNWQIDDCGLVLFIYFCSGRGQWGW